MQPPRTEFQLEHELEAAAFGLEAEHGSAYRTARQQYLRQLLTDPNQPRHVLGWVTQELNRLAQVERAQQQGRRGPGGSARNLRGVPGLDVGHKLGKHDQHDPRNFRLEDARFNRARPGLARRVGVFQKYREGEANFEAEMEQAAERMDAADMAGQFRNVWRAFPPDIKQEIQRRAQLIWQMRGSYLGQFLVALNGLFAQNPAGWQQALVGNRAATIQQLALLAGQMARLPAKGATVQRGLSDAQVRQFHRRQQARGHVPGRSRQTGRDRELELEIDRASRQLEAEPFFTKVTPIPGIGNKEGHEILTRHAMRGLPLSAAEKSAVEFGVIRPDRGGRSYWNFPRAALGSLKAAAQPAHSLRPTPSTTVPAALRLIRARFAGLHARALRASSRSTALEWLGEALHLLQDSFSSAHVERIGGTGRIRHIRAFFIRFGWPPLSRAPHEHNAPSDSRDDVYLHGALRREAAAAIRASRVYLVMALRHLRAPRAPGHARELQAFMNRHLAS
ncbi:MAG TPA: hypothetical protein VJU77_00635 [Chthoniobacterales bacterium]|nr:hypothetical protein [Chthoniobacterales bacterium]